MQKAISYLRFSDAVQAHGDSKRRQWEKTEKYAKERNLEIVESYEDLGVSAYRGRNIKHGALGTILDMAKNGVFQQLGIQHILCEGFDRLSRMEVDEAFDLFRDIIKSGLTIHTVKDQMVYDRSSIKNPMYLFSSIMIMVRANEESAMKSFRLKEARDQNRAEARAGTKQMTTVAPYWLEWDKDFEWNGKRPWFKPIPARAQVVQDIFQMTADGHSIYYICQKLSNDKVPTFRKGKGKAKDGWSTSYISKILKSQEAIGTMQPYEFKGADEYVASGDPILNYYPPVVTMDLFKRAQEGKRPRNTTKGRTGKTYTNLFKGLLKCAWCNDPETFEPSTMQVRGMGQGRKNGKIYHYLICSAKRKNGTHLAKRNFRYDKFEELFLKHVRDFDVSKVVIDRVGMQEAEPLRNKVVELEYGLKNHKDQLENLNRRYDKEADDEKADHIMSRITVKKGEIHETERNLKTASDELKKHQFKQTKRSNSIGVIEDLTTEMEKARKAGTARVDELYAIRERLSMAIRSVVDEVRFDTETGDIDITVFNMLKGYRFNNGRLVGSFDLRPDIAAGLIPIEALTTVGTSTREGNQITVTYHEDTKVRKKVEKRMDGIEPTLHPTDYYSVKKNLGI